MINQLRCLILEWILGLLMDLAPKGSNEQLAITRAVLIYYETRDGR